MKKALFVFLLFPVFIFGQVDTAAVRAEVDSLFGEIDKAIKGRQFDDVSSLIGESEKRISTVFGRRTELYANFLTKRGTILLYKGMVFEVEPFFKEALAIRKEVWGEEHPKYALSLSNLGYLYQKLGYYEKAEALALEDLAVKKKVLSEDDPSYAGSFGNLGIVYWKMGNYEKAEFFFLNALLINEKSYGKEHNKYASLVANLGILYHSMGNYEKAESFWLEALFLRERIFGEEHPKYAESLGHLGALYMTIGNYEKALSFYENAINIYEKMLGKERWYYAPFLDILNNLEALHKEMRDYEKAKAILHKLVEYRGYALGKKHEDYATSLHNLGLLYYLEGQFEKSDSFCQESLVIREEIFGKEHVVYANNLNSLGVMYHKTGQYEKAESFLQESKAIREKTLGKEHRDFVQTLNNLGALYFTIGACIEAGKLFFEANEINKLLLIRGHRYLSTSELSEYIQFYEEKKDQYYSFNQIRDRQNPSIYDNALFYKGFILNSVTSKLNRVLVDSAKQNLLLQHKSYLRRLAKEYTKPIAERQNVAELEEKANTLEKELVRTVVGYGDAIRQVEWQEVRDALQAGEAALEFVHYDYYTPDPTDSVMYAALLLRPGDEQPHFIPLFEERQLKKLLNKEGIKDKNYYSKLYSYDLDASLYSLIWQQLDSLLEGVDKIYASPSGLLHRLNLGAIMKDATSSFADHYELNIVGSTRQLVITNGAPENQDLSAAIYGGIRYDMDSTAIASALDGRLDTVQFHDGGELSFSYVERSTPQRGRSWDYLPGTAKEVEAITNLMVGQEDKVSSYQGYAATEESIKAIGQRGDAPRILHIATHGYFYPDPADSLKNTSSLDYSPAFKVSDHPMIRSGLIMAGGNHVWKKNPPIAGLEDGILTAYEVSQLDLRNTELAVLSACETGLGDIDGNEGVYGLQRAFKIAGVDKLIMSLWSVPDQQTQEMMVLFYENWLEEGMEIEDAFRAAQREMRERYEDHYYWASFVLIK